MAVKTYYVASGVDGNFGALVDGVAQTAASRTDGWTVAKIAAANSSDFDAGTKQASGSFSTQSGSPKPSSGFLTGANANSFKTPVALTGTFAASSWVFTFAVRAGTASSQAGRIRMRVYRTPDIALGPWNPLDGGTTQVGTTSSALSTSADVTSVVTWSPGATITLNNEFLLFQIAWEITTASGSNSGDVVIRTGSSGSTGSRLVTPDYVPAPIAVTFPTTPLIDDFNRADAVLASPNYTAYGAAPNTFLDKIVSQQVTAGQGSNGTMWNTPTGVDCEIYVTVATPPPDSQFMYLAVRQPTIAASQPMYQLKIGNLGGAFSWQLQRQTGSFTIGNSAAKTLSAGDRVGLQAKGNLITALYQAGGTGPWTIICQATDSTITAGGYIGWNIGSLGSGIFIDNFSGGGIPGVKISALTDSFDTTVDKAGKWLSATAGTTWDSTGKRAQMACATTYSVLATSSSVPAYDLTGSQVFARMLPPATGNGSREMFMEMIGDSASQNKLSMFVSGGQFQARRTVSGAASGSSTAIPYDPVAHAWWRIRESGGTTFMDYSSDSVNWTNLWSVANGMTITAMWLNFSCGYYGTESASNGFVDNVNIKNVPVQLDATMTLTPSMSRKGIFKRSLAAFSSLTPNLTKVYVPVVTFPTTPLIDNFNRADGAIGSQYSMAWTGSIPDTITSNQVVAKTGGSGSYLNTPLPANQEVYFKVVTPPSGGTAGEIDIEVRWQGLSGPGYYASIFNGAWQINKYDGANLTSLNSVVASPPSAGDSVGMSIVGNVITLFYKAGSSPWVQMVQATDSTYTGGGYVGWWMGDGGVIDDFSGGSTSSAINTPVALNATTTLVPAMSDIEKFFRTLPVTPALAPVMSRRLLAARMFAVTSPLITTQVKAIFKTFSAGTTLTPGMTSAKAYGRTISATTVIAPGFSRLAKLQRTQAISSTLVPTMSRLFAGGRTFAATVALSPTISNKLSAFRTLAVGGTSASATDDFNRANGGLGPNWLTNAEGNNPTISGNKVIATGISGATWVGGTSGDDQFAQIDGMTNFPDASTVSGLMLRSQLAGATCYHARYFSNAGSPVFQIYKRVSPASLSQLGSNVTAPVVVSTDVLRFEVVGNTLTLKFNGVVQISLTDTSIQSGGAPGIRLNGSGSADNFQAGTIGSVFTPGMVVNRSSARALAANVVLIPDMTKNVIHGNVNVPLSFNVGMTLTPTMLTQKQYFRTLAITAVFAPTISKRLLALRLLAVSTPVSPLLTARKAAARLLAAPVAISPSMSKLVKESKSLDVTTTITPSMSLGSAKNQFLNASVSFSPTMKRVIAKTLAVSVIFITGSQRKTSKQMPVTTTLTPTISRLSRFLRRFDSVTPLQADLDVVAGKKITLSVPISFNVRMTNGRINRIILSASSNFTALMGFVRFLARKTEQTLFSAKMEEAQLLAVQDPNGATKLESATEEETSVLLSANIENPELASAGEETPGLRSVS